MATRATLGGFELTNDDPVGWHVLQGVDPYQRVFTCERSVADAILAKSAQSLTDGLELRIDSDSRPQFAFGGLTALSLAPARAPYLAGVLVADCRWKWSRKHVLRHYNVRRYKAETRMRLDGVFGSFEQIGALPNVTYASYSLIGGTQVWTVRDVMGDLLSYLTDGNYSLADVDWAALSTISIEGLELDDAGPDALARVLALAPGLTVWVDSAGVTQVTHRAAGGELDQLQAAGPPIVGPMLAASADLSISRPSKIEVYFTPETEIRFDFQETACNNMPPTLQAPVRYLENVLPLPDVKTTIGGKDLAQGTWVPINQALIDAWNSTATVWQQGGGGALPAVVNLSFDKIQRMWLLGNDVFGQLLPQLGTDPIWMRRIECLKDHYRQTFMVHRSYMDLIRSLKAERLALVDPNRGVRAPASVYTNWTFIPTTRGAAFSADAAANRLSYTTTGYPGTGIMTGKLSAGLPCPIADVKMLSQDLGIFHVAYQRDAFTHIKRAIPSAIVNQISGGTTIKLSLATVFETIVEAFGLSPDHLLALVATAVPASPNDISQLYKVEVTPDDVRPLLPPRMASRLGTCLGPVWQVRVNAAVLPARIAWDDDSAPAFDDAYRSGGISKLKALLEPQLVRDYAKAVAAEVYSLLTDRVEGSFTTALDDNLEPQGMVASVEHELRPSGALLTTMRMPPERRGLNAFSVLPENTRRIILRMVQNP